MKTQLLLCLAASLTLLACEKSGGEDPRPVEKPLSHGMIVLGEKLNNPYTVQNVREAYNNLYPTRASSDIQPTNLYVRFLPESDKDFEVLKASGVRMLDHPMDYRIIEDGDYYHDPTLPEENITWHYAVVDKEFHFPDGIYYEVLDECFLSENQAEATRSALNVDWEALEEESYRLTGNAELYHRGGTKGGTQPSGRITISDPDYLGGKPVGLSGVQIMTNVFVKFSTTYTDRDGYYTIPKSYSGNPYYRVVFQNSKGFAIGFNWILVPASVSTLGKNGPEGISCTITRESDYELFTRGITNNAAYDYFERCQSEWGIAAPPSNLRFWMFKGLSASSAVMMQQGTVYSAGFIGQIIGQWAFLAQLFSPDITIGTKDYGSAYRIYSSVVHEMAHASHYVAVGNGYWNPYIDYILRSYIYSGFKDSYGSAEDDNAGYCEVGEMWAYAMESKLVEDRYHRHLPTFGTGYWFYPQILTALMERGVTCGEIFSALTPGVTTREKLKESLIGKIPSSQKLIEQAFERYR